MSLTRQQIDQYHEHGYVAGPRVLSDEMVNTLKSRIDDILAGRVDFPDELLGETVDRSSAKGQLPSVKIVNRPGVRPSAQDAGDRRGVRLLV